MMKLFKCILCVFLIPCLLLQAEEILNLSLQKEILAMRDLDQKAREECVNSNFDTENLKKVETIDKLHQVKLEEMIQAYGWPGYKLVGKDGSEAMWLLVQHVPDIEFQKKCLELLVSAVKKGDANPANLAYLQDRILVKEGKKQIYGTQWNEKQGKHFIYHMHEPSKVNERRMAVGLCSIEDSIKGYIQAYHLTEDDVSLE